MAIKKILITAMVSLFLLTSGSAAWAKTKPYGQLTLTLYNKYCTGRKWERWGCKGYFHFRLDWDKKRGGATSACKNSCNKQIQLATGKEACLKGCQNARNLDNN